MFSMAFLTTIHVLEMVVSNHFEHSVTDNTR